MTTASDSFFNSDLEIPTKIIRVLIADDHPVVRDGLAAVLDTKPFFEVVAQANDGLEAVEQFRLHRPDVTILDLRMPKMGGDDAIETIRAEFPDACFIMLTIYDGDEDIYRGFRAGAKAYLLKDTSCEEIIRVAISVCQGEKYVSPRIGQKLAHNTEYQKLSTREIQVLEQIATGKNNKAIGSVLGISESTVKFHINNLLDKLGAKDRTHAVILALKRGIIKF